MKQLDVVIKWSLYKISEPWCYDVNLNLLVIFHQEECIFIVHVTQISAEGSFGRNTINIFFYGHAGCNITSHVVRVTKSLPLTHASALQCVPVNLCVYYLNESSLQLRDLSCHFTAAAIVCVPYCKYEAKNRNNSGTGE